MPSHNSRPVESRKKLLKKFYIISSVMQAFWLFLTHDVLEDRRIVTSSSKNFFPVYFSSLLYKTNRFQIAVRLFSNRTQWTSKCGKNISDALGCASSATFLFLPHFDVLCDLLVNRRTAIWNLFVKYCLLEIGRNVWYLNIRGLFHVHINSARWSWEAGRNLRKLRKPSNSPVRSLAAS